VKIDAGPYLLAFVAIAVGFTVQRNDLNSFLFGALVVEVLLTLPNSVEKGEKAGWREVRARFLVCPVAGCYALFPNSKLLDKHLKKVHK
jgi:hypothetical protein